MANNISLLHHVKIHSSHYSDVTWAWWRLKSPATRLFVHTSICSINKKNVKAPHYRPSLRIFNGEHWFSVTKDRWSRYSFQPMTSSCTSVRGVAGPLHIFQRKFITYRWLSKSSLRDIMETISNGRVKLIRFIYSLLISHIRTAKIILFYLQWVTY